MGTTEPNGVLEETASSAVLYRLLDQTTAGDYEGALRRAIAHHAAYGITTIQDGAATPQDVAGAKLSLDGSPQGPPHG